MTRIETFISSLLLATAVAVTHAAVAADATPARPGARPPIEAFFGKADLRLGQLSPSGRWFAALAPTADHRTGLVMIDLEGEHSPHVIETSTSDELDWFTWVSDDWLIFSVDDPTYRGVGSIGSGLMSVSRDGSKSQQLIRRTWGSTLAFGGRLNPDHVMLALGPYDTNEIVVGQYRFDPNGDLSEVAPLMLNVATGSLRSIGEGSPEAVGWMVDAQGRPRVAIRNDGTETITSWQAQPGGPWKQIARASNFHQPFYPAYLENDGRLVVQTWDADGYLELRRFDPATSRPAAQPFLSAPGYSGDVWPIVEPSSGAVVGARLTVDETTTAWFTPAMKKIQADIDRQLAGRTNVLSCRRCDDPRVVLVRSYSDIYPGEYLVYRPHDNTLQRAGQSRPAIAPAAMSPMRLHRIKARDGEDLPVWITRPASAAPDKPAPAVVLVHGGPFVRGTEREWNPESQFLASRGYVVIEPEFRGSTGYGVKHFHAGFKQWGLAMQDDVTDALKFAVGNGWADAGRVCIMGASYGGYSTLIGLVNDPDQYRCGVAWVALSDPRFMFTMHWSDISNSSRRFRLPEVLGDPKTDAAKFIATSPVEQAARIKAPVLLAYGGLDTRVPIQNGERMRDALQRHGKKVEWVVYPEEGHGFRRLENRLDFWRRVEAFLDRNLR